LCAAAIAAAWGLCPSGLAADTELAFGWDSPGGGLALEAAIRQGFFKEEGITASAARTRLPEFAEAVASGRIAAGELDGRVLGLYRDGAKVGPAAGLYSGFLEIIGLKERPEGKIKLAVENIGGGPAVAAARHYRSLGVDPDQGMEWVEAPLDKLLTALSDGKATAAARWEEKRSGQAGGHGAAAGHGGEAAGGHKAAAGHGGKAGEGHKAAAGHDGGAGEGHKAAAGHGGEKHGTEGESHGDAGNEPYRIIYSASASLPPPSEDGEASANPHAKHTAAHHFFTSFVVLSRDLYEKDPALAAAVTRAWIRGAAWVGENKEEAARIGIEAKVWDGDAKSLEAEIERYMWMPGVSHAKEHLKSYIREWVRRGLLPAGTDEGKFFDGFFIQALPDLN
jgi:ABC-type nitrate/sulfonate/bicarbonate transport system substrate-binding protein